MHNSLEELNWKHVDIGKEFRRTAKLKEFKIEDFGSIPNPLLRQIDSKIEHHFETETDIIWDGRLA